MKTTADFLDDLQKKLGVTSDYAVAGKMEMHRQHISHYRNLKGSFDDAMSLRVADILETDPAFVIACMHHQRSKQAEVKKVWERIATSMAGITVAILVAVALPFVDLPTNPVQNSFDNNIHYANK